MTSNATSAGIAGNIKPHGDVHFACESASLLMVVRDETAYRSLRVAYLDLDVMPAAENKKSAICHAVCGCINRRELPSQMP